MKNIFSMILIYVICFTTLVLVLSIGTFLLTPLVNLVALVLFGITIQYQVVLLSLLGTIVAGFIRSFIITISSVKQNEHS